MGVDPRDLSRLPDSKGCEKSLLTPLKGIRSVSKPSHKTSVMFSSHHVLLSNKQIKPQANNERGLHPNLMESPRNGQTIS